MSLEVKNDKMLYYLILQKEIGQSFLDKKKFNNGQTYVDGGSNIITLLEVLL